MKQFLVLSLKESADLAFSSASPRVNSSSLFGLLGLSPLRHVGTPSVTTVVWHPPPFGWVKVNTHGSFRDPSQVGFGGVFRCNTFSFLGAFSYKVVATSALDAELLAVMEAVRVAWLKGWLSLWLETDSLLVLHYFKSPNLVPWRLKVHWANCIYVTQQMNFHISHVFREGNSVADALANFGAVNPGSHWWDTLPQFLFPSFGHDSSSKPSFRFAYYSFFLGSFRAPLHVSPSLRLVSFLFLVVA